VGFSIDSPLRVLPVFEAIAERAEVSAEDMWLTFNMGCGFCCIVPAGGADAAVRLLERHHPGAARIGTVTADAGVVELPRLGLSFS
jgi:phosphoribosylformylglycinamidine cyclo-ligase